MSVLVLGGAGYIGSHMVRRLLDQGQDVVVVDNLVKGHRAAVAPEAKFYQVDIRDKKALSEVFEKENIDAVVHFAAFSIVPESVAEPLMYFDNNTAGMVTLLEVMKDFDVKKIVFSSTAATYGNPVNIPIKETDPQNPINPYGESKLMMEKMMAWADSAYDIKWVALRYFNVAGAIEDGSIGEDHGPETHLVPIILQAAAGQRDYIEMFGDDYNTPDGFNVRDYVHVVDLADAHILALDYLAKGNKSAQFNLGSATGFSVKEMVEAAREATGVNIEAKVGPRRPGDPDILVADSTQAREVLGWQPKFDNVKDIIKTAWNWKEKHPNGYDDRK
ncbi:UDP-glucose 4-epimerase GalE [Fructobacillus tropaeoli]|uniref:UDP-glucose 4-epimerase n=1 Tax=Fructobacillus tropaeoli TaxID=709323 RepID=A0A3F3H110_9LACO|nr:UDP-glucose 4-epimerase GalE [Fructobacillus tropaeoli]NLS38460.1 UDP-glucose 4-epimerase GalE [Fructobacillus tropaeoli]CAK1243377.1 UDP-glucose 4-epimerase (GalE) [Fructobacillus tropaeoli]CAK1246988.1 UDP-glucose 4-epimerase (GalE) [Fructobacillus tropaeoli]CAK1252236.1 UDP-glucose 4-epimerase (GalE) [Fructobacillus tropaeoli]GAP04725.1 UDP-galactose 4-epimerase [Fructobacillus tropaeoli]